MHSLAWMPTAISPNSTSQQHPDMTLVVQTKCIGQSHEIVSGDTCVSISNTYNMTVAQLKALNPVLRDCANLPMLASVCIGASESHETSLIDEP